MMTVIAFDEYGHSDYRVIKCLLLFWPSFKIQEALTTNTLLHDYDHSLIFEDIIISGIDLFLQPLKKNKK